MLKYMAAMIFVSFNASAQWATIKHPTSEPLATISKCFSELPTVPGKSQMAFYGDHVNQGLHNPDCQPRTLIVKSKSIHDQQVALYRDNPAQPKNMLGTVARFKPRESLSGTRSFKNADGSMATYTCQSPSNPSKTATRQYMVNLDNNPPRLMVDPDTKSKEIAATSGNVDDNAKTSLLKATRLELSLRVQALDNKEVQGGPGDLASMEACLALMAAPPGQPRDLATLGAVASWKARLCKKAKTYCSENASPRGGSERQGEDPAAKGTN